MHILKKMVITIALAFPAMALAQSTQELKAELEALKLHVKKLEAMIEKVTAQTVAPVQTPQVSGEAVELAEFNRIKIKTEGLEDALDAAGLKNLKISGYIDPTYIYNKNRKTSSFVFLNNNSNINGSEEVFSYDNTYFGSFFLSLEKEFEGGSLVKLTLAPSKGTASGFNFGNIVSEASFSVPLSDPNTRLIGGQLPDWTGYEATSSVDNKLITHNLLFDFTAPSFYTGMGVELTRGKFGFKALAGNLNRARINDAQRRSPGLFYRGDYTLSEFSSVGFSGVHSGFDDKTQFGRLDIVEVDGSFIRGEWTLQGQLSAGRQKPSADNGFVLGSTRFYGLSSLAAYRFTERLEGIARFDYIYNKRNGGGIFGSTFGGFGGDCVDTTGADATCPDGLNGFGSGLVFDGTKFVVADPTEGSNRATLSLGLNYAFRPGVNFKAEYRYDRSTSNTFLDSNGVYRRDNHILGFSTLLSF